MTDISGDILVKKNLYEDDWNEIILAKAVPHLKWYAFGKK